LKTEQPGVVTSPSVYLSILVVWLLGQDFYIIELNITSSSFSRLKDENISFNVESFLNPRKRHGDVSNVDASSQFPNYLSGNRSFWGKVTPNRNSSTMSKLRCKLPDAYHNLPHSFLYLTYI